MATSGFPAKHRYRCGYVTKRQILVKGLTIEFPRNVYCSQNSLRLRGESEAPIALAVVDRLDPETIATDQQTSPAGCPRARRRTSH